MNEIKEYPEKVFEDIKHIEELHDIISIEVALCENLLQIIMNKSL